MVSWGQKRFQVSGLGHQDSGTGIQVQVQVQELCHLSSVLDSAIKGWDSTTCCPFLWVSFADG
jgi:hypothetical protein